MNSFTKHLHLHPDELGKEAFKNSELPAKPNGEPIDDLSKRDKADPKTKSTEALKAGDEVQPSHFCESLEL